MAPSSPWVALSRSPFHLSTCILLSSWELKAETGGSEDTLGMVLTLDMCTREKLGGGTQTEQRKVGLSKEATLPSQPMFNLTFEVSSWVENKTQRYL